MGLLWISILSGPLAAPPAQLTRGPYLQSLLSTSVTIAWRTDAQSVGSVRIRAEGSPDLVVAEASPSTEHRLAVTGLSPGTSHEYVILEGERVLAEGLGFRTAPPAGEGELRAAVAGDSGIGLDEQYAVAALLESIEPDIFLHTGDYDYVDDLDRSVFTPYGKLLQAACFLPARGNHDIRVPWRKSFDLPGVASTAGEQLFYSLDWGPAHLTFFDSNLDALSGKEQSEFVRADLAAARARGAPWLVLVLHEPVYTIGSYSVLELASRDLVESIADEFEVDLVLSGHDHNYQRSHPVRRGVPVDAWQDPAFATPRGTVYVVTGGGGAVLYPEISRSDHRFHRTFRYAHHALDMRVTRDEIRIRALGTQHEVFDSFVLDRSRPARGYRFVRGDVDAGGRIDIGDAISILRHLFLGAAIECPTLAEEAANVDGNEIVDIGDAVSLLSHLFVGGPPPASPYPDCGPAEDPMGSWCTREGCE